MPLETATYINQLVATNPAETDSEGQGADHLRLVKSTLQASFPNITGAMTATQAQLNAAATQGGVPTGAMFHFMLDPGTSVVARGGTATGTEAYVEADGSAYAYTKFPNLSALMGVGAGNITVPELKTTGRFLRSRTASVTIGTSQANQNAAHTHTLTDPGHTHTATDSGHGHTGSTASSVVTDPGHVHLNSVAGTNSWMVARTGGSPGITGGANADSEAMQSATTGISVATTVSIATGTANVTNASNTTGISVVTLAALKPDRKRMSLCALSRPKMRFWGVRGVTLSSLATLSI